MPKSAFNSPTFFLVDNLCLTIGNRKIIEDLSFDIPKGKKVAILGLNGAGKSSLIRLIVGELKPQQGLIEFQNLSPTELSYKNKLGYQASNMQAIPSLSVIEYLELCCQLKEALANCSQGACCEIIKQWQLENIATSFMAKLSVGNLQKLSIAQAFLGSPELIVLDEPTATLDPVERKRFVKNLTQLKEGSTCIFSSHHLDEAVAVADIVLMLHQGKLVAKLDLAEQEEFWLVSYLSVQEVEEVVRSIRSAGKPFENFSIAVIFQQNKTLLRIHGIAQDDWQIIIEALLQKDSCLVDLGRSTEALMPLFELLAQGEL